MAIKLGDRGSEVRNLQRQLKSSGFDPGSADGRFGAKTADAVRRFQTSKGLTADAKVGRNTQTALTAARNRDSFTPAPTTTKPAARTDRTARTPGERPYQEISRFARERGFTVTSTTGGHHLGRGHREGRAVDVRTRDHTPAQVEQFMREARAAGYWVNDERRHGNSARTGPHIHLEQR